MSATPRSESTQQDIGQRLSCLKEAIWKKRPVLQDIMQKRGAKNLYDYSLDFLDVNPSPVLDARKEELIAATHALLSQRLGADVADRAARQLRSLALVSTTDHHGVIQHPFFVNANIISALPYGQAAKPELNSLIVFSFASVSLNNASAYSRGLLFHGDGDAPEQLVKLPILPDKLKMGVVYATRAFTPHDLEHTEKQLRNHEHAKTICATRAESIRQLLHEAFAADDVLGAHDLNEQCTKLTYRVWPTFFRDNGGQRVPDLLYVDIETLVTNVVCAHHLHSPSLLHRIMFDANMRERALVHFDGIPGAFSRNDGWGTYLFWGLDENGHRVRLSVHGDALCAANGQKFCALDPSAIEEALRAKKIYPSMMLCYLTVALYYGMKCLGGFSQVHDLTLMKESWRQLLLESSEESEAEAIVPIQTKELSGDGMVLSYYTTRTGDARPATGIDMMIERDLPFDHYVQLAQHVSLEEIMNPMLPEMYTVLYPIDQRDPSLAGIPPEEIFRETSLRKKIEAARMQTKPAGNVH